MHYSNHDNRLQLPNAAAQPAPQKYLSLERGARGIRLRVRTAATMARRKLLPFGLPAALLVLIACVTPDRVAKAQLGYDPFAGDTVHNEERWATYSDASLNGTNRPGTTFVNGVNAAAANAGSFNFGVTNINPSSGSTLITGGTGNGNIYSFNATLTLTLTSTVAPTVGTFNTVIFSIRTLGNTLDFANVRLTLSTGQSVAPSFYTTSNSGSGMSASAQSAFQFDLSGLGGSNNFMIAVPGSATSVSFSSSQLDATTTIHGMQNLVPEPSSVAFVALALGGLTVAGVRCRRRA